MIMNKIQLAEFYRKESNGEISKAKALKEINDFIETLNEALAMDGKVKFHEKATFEVLVRKPRVISNPATRELIEIYPKKTVKFRLSKMVKKD